ncbi:alpha/beta hydrolase [Nocardioides sp. R-C-SC26]|uniref:alpha/beta hydrolase n=1 Tax=Nocardioides sp. R-C-SC26 TaxID=2870414 RepID=UPI001E3BC40C|nr:alpha/beta hydrolase [Nocardioides sp. R-C-SC26]
MAPPTEVPSFDVAPELVRDTSTAWLAASAQIDDLGTFASGAARVGDWTDSVASRAYHRRVGAIGDRSEAMSLALRRVAQRTGTHADELIALGCRRDDLLARRRRLVVDLAAWQIASAEAATPQQRTDADATANSLSAAIADFDSEVVRWTHDLRVEEQAMVRELERVLELAAVERLYGGVPDPADPALHTFPGAGATPSEIRSWWDALGEAEQGALIAASPGSIGNLDGIPAAVRDEANHVRLVRDLADLRHTVEAGVASDGERRRLENAEAAHDALMEIEGRDDLVTAEPVRSSLYLYDPDAFGSDGRIAIAAGDPDAADNLAVLVPGLGTDATSAPEQAARALDLYEAARMVAPDESSAAMAWIGYDAPSGADSAAVVREDMAADGGRRLADAIDGLRASRSGDPAHLTVIAHSYGSTTAGHAAHDGGLAVDDLAFVGSPGVGGHNDDVGDLGLERGQVWAAANSRDPVALLGDHGWINLSTLNGAGMGDDPTEDSFGAQRFRAEDAGRGDRPSLEQHSRYFDPGSESLHNLARIVVGDDGDVLRAEPKHDPLFGGPHDPEWDRRPTPVPTR